jgi:hypothetical protein
MHRSPNEGAARARTRERSAGFRPARLAPILALLLLSVASTGCFAILGAAAGGAAVGVAVSGVAEHRDAGTPPRGAGASLAVAYAPARDIAVVSRMPAETTWVRGAISLLGRVVATRGDTLWLAVSEGRGSAGVATCPTGWEPPAEIVPGPGVAVRVLSRAPGAIDNAAVGALLGAVLGTAAFVLAVLVYCSSQRCMD